MNLIKKLTAVSLLILILLITACNQPSPTAQIFPINPTPTPDTIVQSVPTELPTSQPTALPTVSPTPLPTPTETAVSTPFYTGEKSTACGQILPLLPTNNIAVTTQLNPSAESLAALEAILPPEARPAFARILDAPETVGLVAFRMGDEANGVTLNENMQMPLASVSKIINLVAYAEAVGAGEIDSTQVVTLETIEQYYLPNFDLGAHPRAIEELEDNGRLLANPSAVLLDEIPWMMMRHSSNAASDYIHRLLGQEEVEETAVSLNLTSQTAPCTFLGQFLAMGNHTRPPGTDRDAIDAYLANPDIYGDDASLLADAYIQDKVFRDAEQRWRQTSRQPSLNIQRTFSHQISTHGTAQEYANAMARIAQNGLSNSESSFLARRHLEWPMQFEANQKLFSNLGYKNGALPGIRTTIYYAYPLGESTPIIVALFYRDLPNRTYQQWRHTLTDDEFARWLLYEPAAIPTLKAVIQSP